MVMGSHFRSSGVKAIRGPSWLNPAPLFPLLELERQIPDNMAERGEQSGTTRTRKASGKKAVPCEKCQREREESSGRFSVPLALAWRPVPSFMMPE